MPQMAYSSEQLTRFVEHVESGLVRGAVETFWGLENEFCTLVQSGFVQEVFNEDLRRTVANPDYVGDWRPGQLLIHRGRGYALTVSLFEKPRQYIHTSPFYAMYAPVGPESLRYEMYRLPQAYQNAVFDPGLRLEHARSGCIAAGQALLLHSDSYAYDFVVDRPQLVLKFTTAPFQTLEWLFKKDDLHAWQAGDSEINSTQLRVAAYILGKLAHPSSMEPLAQLGSHPHHAVRWAAIQSLGRLSRTAALEALERARQDPHPHICRAASKALQTLNQES
jgi:hypothetical protein